MHPWPPGPREAIAAAVARTGCRLRPDPELGGFRAVDCPDYHARAALVDALAEYDARYDGRIRRLGLELVARVRDPRNRRELAALIQRAVQERVRYIGEAGDQIQDAWTTWSYGAGDCDCQTRLVLAIARALGLPVHLCKFVKPDGAIAHVCAALDGAPPTFLETTLAARFGEHPYAAARRLNANRTDLR